jgi:hypothetical protein
MLEWKTLVEDRGLLRSMAPWWSVRQSIITFEGGLEAYDRIYNNALLRLVNSYAALQTKPIVSNLALRIMPVIAKSHNEELCPKWT